MEIFKNRDEDIILEVAENALWATLTINREDRPIIQDEITELIKEAGIKEGFLNSLNSETNRVIGTSFKIAEVPGLDEVPSLDIFFSNEEIYFKKLPLNESNASKLIYLHKETPIGKLKIATYSLSKKNIRGEYLLALDGDNGEIAKYLGEGVYYNNETKEFVSDINGYLHLDSKGRLNVLSELVIEHNINREYGNIYILGNLRIKGNVNNLQRIHVLGDLEVEGNVYQSNIFVDNNFKVVGNIENCESIGVVCKGNITCEEIIKSKVFAGGEFISSGDISFSKVIGDELVTITNGGTVMASNLSSAKNIIVDKVLNDSTTISSLEITVAPYIKEELLLLSRELVYLQESNPSDAKIATLIETITTLENQLATKIEELLESEPEESIGITVNGGLEEGVILRVLKESQTVKEDLKDKKIELINLRRGKDD